jgi:hypothetical protein
MIRCAVVVIALCACSKKDDKPADKPADPSADKSGEAPAAKPKVDTSGPCGPLAVLADGAPIEGLVHGTAVIMENAGYRTAMIQLFNHDKATCEEALSGRRSVQENEINVRAWHGAAPGVGIDAFTQIEGTITLDKPTETVGETMQICVRAPVVFTPNAGAYSGKKVSIAGTFAAKFCGVNKS